MKMRTRKSVCSPRGIIGSNVQLPPTTESHNITLKTLPSTQHHQMAGSHSNFLKQLNLATASSKNSLEQTILKRLTPTTACSNN